MVINLRERPCVRLLEAKAIMAFDFAKRRNMEYFFCRQPVGGLDRTLISVGHQIVVPLTEGIVNFTNGCAQQTGTIKAIPDTNRVKHIAQHSRKCLQNDLAICLGDAFSRQQFARPHFEIGTVTRPEITRHQRQQIKSIARQPPIADFIKPRDRDTQKKYAI